MTLPHKCFTEQIYEICPFCGSNQAVYVGHGTARHCATCTMTWGEGEVIIAEMASPMAQKVNDLPGDIKRRVKKLETELAGANDVDRRLTRLRNISEAEWQRAVDIDGGYNAS